MTTQPSPEPLNTQFKSQPHTRDYSHTQHSNTRYLSALAQANRELVIDEQRRTVELAFSSETPYLRWFGNEILDHSPNAVNLQRLRSGGALLMDHDPSDQVGVV